jgi:hypothetical protein
MSLDPQAAMLWSIMNRNKSIYHFHPKEGQLSKAVPDERPVALQAGHDITPISWLGIKMVHDYTVLDTSCSSSGSSRC